MPTLATAKKRLTKFRPLVYSRHPTHNVLRDKLPLMNFRSVVRLGSVTDVEDSVTNGGKRVEINTIQAITNSASKSLMKQCFRRDKIKTALWWQYANNRFYNYDNPDETDIRDISQLPYPIVSKHIFGSRGTGNTLLNNQEELQQWMRGKNLENYIFEKFYSYSREYRLHVTKNGCFYTCRKVLKNETPQHKRWFRNDSNSNWIIEENPLFDKPTNWDIIVKECVRALNSVGLDIGAFDVKVQSANKKNGNVRENVEFIILESNSAPSFGEITATKYLEEIPKILINKYNEINA